METNPTRLWGKRCRLLGKKRTAIIAADSIDFGRGVKRGYVMLDRPLAGRRLWHISCIELIE